VLVDKGQGNGVADPVNGQAEQRKEDLLPKLRNLEACNQLAHGSALCKGNEENTTPFVIERFGLAFRLGRYQAFAKRQAKRYSLVARGFILLRLGFAGGGITSAVPPLALIFSAADFEKWCALITSFLVSSPSPRMRTPSAGPRASPALSSASASTVSPSLKA